MLVFKSPVAASPTPRPRRRLTKTAEEMAEEAEELEALVGGVRRELQVTLALPARSTLAYSRMFRQDRLDTTARWS